MATGDPIRIKLSDLEKSSAQLDYQEAVKSTGATMQCPVRLGKKLDGSDLWTLPLEPIVSVRGGKKIVRRNIAQGVSTGSVKEQWSLNDYEISITGLLQGQGYFPESDLSKLTSYFVAGQSIAIRCKLLDVLGINLICIESWDLPGTPGLENQRFSISAYSDQYFDLLG